MRLVPVPLVFATLALALPACKASPFAGRATAAAEPAASARADLPPPSPLTPPTWTAPAPLAPPASIVSARPPPPSPAMPSPAAPPPSPRPPKSVAEALASLRADPALAAFADVLDVAVNAAAAATTELRIVRVPALETAARARVGHGTGWAVVTTYLEPGGDADALRAIYLDFDRVGEWTGKPSAHRLEARGDTVLARVDALRTAFGFRYGARWRFEARVLDRGPVRAVVSRQVDDPETLGMLATHGVLLVLPEAGFVRVIECSTSVLDYEVPALLANLAANAAQQEMRLRVVGMRDHWREYVGRSGLDPAPR